MKFNFKKGEFYKIENKWGKVNNYFALKVSKKDSYMDVIPLFDDYDSKIPFVLSLPFQLIKNVKNVSEYELLYMLNSQNANIKLALEKKLFSSNNKYGGIDA